MPDPRILIPESPSMHRLILRCAALALVATLAVPASAQSFMPPRPSPGAKVQQTIGLTDLSVSYSRPGVKGRTIWGALVPYQEPWRTGANEATTFTCSDAIQVEGQSLAAGTYALLTIPTPESWTVVFSDQKDMWGAYDYDAKHDVLRVTVKPVAAEMTERMLFTFDDPGLSSTTLTLRWEKLAVPVRITVDTDGRTLAAARTAVTAAKPDDWRTPYRAASWAFDAGLAADEASTWATTASTRKPNYQTTGLLARMAAKKGDTANAVTLMKKAIAFAEADSTTNKEQLAASRKLLQEWTPAKKK
jgi:Protein of unknown function (DUF2911)